MSVNFHPVYYSNNNSWKKWLHNRAAAALDCRSKHLVVHKTSKYSKVTVLREEENRASLGVRIVRAALLPITLVAAGTISYFTRDWGEAVTRGEYRKEKEADVAFLKKMDERIDPTLYRHCLTPKALNQNPVNRIPFQTALHLAREFLPGETFSIPSKIDDVQYGKNRHSIDNEGRAIVRMLKRGRTEIAMERYQKYCYDHLDDIRAVLLERITEICEIDDFSKASQEVKIKHKNSLKQFKAILHSLFCGLEKADLEQLLQRNSMFLKKYRTNPNISDNTDPMIVLISYAFKKQRSECKDNPSLISFQKLLSSFTYQMLEYRKKVKLLSSKRYRNLNPKEKELFRISLFHGTKLSTAHLMQKTGKCLIATGHLDDLDLPVSGGERDVGAMKNGVNSTGTSWAPPYQLNYSLNYATYNDLKVKSKSAILTMPIFTINLEGYDAQFPPGEAKKWNQAIKILQRDIADQTLGEDACTCLRQVAMDALENVEKCREFFKGSSRLFRKSRENLRLFEDAVRKFQKRLPDPHVCPNLEWDGLSSSKYSAIGEVFKVFERSQYPEEKPEEQSERFSLSLHRDLHKLYISCLDHLRWYGESKEMMECLREMTNRLNKQIDDYKKTKPSVLFNHNDRYFISKMESIERTILQLIRLIEKPPQKLSRKERGVLSHKEPLMFGVRLPYGNFVDGVPWCGEYVVRNPVQIGRDIKHVFVQRKHIEKATAFFGKLHLKSRIQIQTIEELKEVNGAYLENTPVFSAIFSNKKIRRLIRMK